MQDTSRKVARQKRTAEDGLAQDMLQRSLIRFLHPFHLATPCPLVVQAHPPSPGSDDFTAWVTGSTAQSNREGIEAIIKNALDWERRSGAAFNIQKTAIIHFTRKTYKTDAQPFMIKGQTVKAQDTFGGLHLGLEAAMELRISEGCLHQRHGSWKFALNASCVCLLAHPCSSHPHRLRLPSYLPSAHLPSARLSSPLPCW